MKYLRRTAIELHGIMHNTGTILIEFRKAPNKSIQRSLRQPLSLHPCLLARLADLGRWAQ
jgi:hypothetical protein